MPHNRQKKIAVINDFCGFGRCSIAVSLPIISAMKIQCCPLPTAIFSNHTAFDSFHCTDYTKHMAAYIAEWEKLHLSFNGIITGFLGSPEQVDIVKSFLEKFRTEKNTVVIDPVMGDDGQLYSTYSPALAEKMSTLVPFADILTPNLTEACILTETEYKSNMSFDELREIAERLSRLGPPKIVISGLESEGDIENFIFEKGKEPLIIKEHKAGPCRAGTGDVFSSIIAADTVNGVDFSDAVRHASGFIAECLRLTAAMQIPETDGICFEELLHKL